jgi:hypothetical protein
MLKLMSRFGIAIGIFIAVLGIQLFRPTYNFVDTLIILAIGMILGASYIEIQEHASDYFDKQSKLSS